MKTPSSQFLLYSSSCLEEKKSTQNNKNCIYDIDMIINGSREGFFFSSMKEKSES